MIVTIDGPAGVGKSSVARGLADRLGFRFLDTGAMYRAMAFAALQQSVDLHDPQALAELVHAVDLQLDNDQALVNGTDVTREIRLPEVTEAVRFVADNLQVRAHLSALQRRLADGGNIVSEGRDQGTIVFPTAKCKVFLTASAEIRARRRRDEMLAQGLPVSLNEVLKQQKLRDRHDSERPVGRLQKANDAVELITDDLSHQQVLDALEELVRKRL